jgi:Family of unknown function (DUF6152)
MKVPTIAVVGMIVAAGPAFAHHPFASEFDANAPVRVIGTVTQVNWNNPHVKIRVTTSAATGSESWTLEAASPAELARKGWTRNTLKTGDHVTIEGYMAKSAPLTGAARVVELSDGKRLSAADEKDGGPKSLPGRPAP